MTKTELLNELESRLIGLPKEDIQERLDFYSEMIDDRMEDGKSEEEAVSEIGTVDEIVSQIANETSLMKIIKERTRPKRTIKVWEIILIALGFPIWFPLLLTALVLILVAYILLWTLVIVVYSLEIAFVATSVLYLMDFFILMFTGDFNIGYLGLSVVAAGSAVLLYFGCVAATKGTLQLSKNIILDIKKKIIVRNK